MEQKTSQRKIESNRQNALKSTGPKTPEGKRAVRYNALKHGLLAREVVIDSDDGKENRGDFETLLSQLEEDLQPVGMLEQMLVEKIRRCTGGWPGFTGLKGVRYESASPP